MKNMINQALSGVALCVLLATADAAGQTSATLERSIGRVILESDKYPHGAHFVSAAIEREHNRIRKLRVQERVRFFWSVLMNVRLDASYLVELVELIARDCPQEFERELVTFINKNRTLPPPEPQTSIAQGTLTTLRLIRVRLQQK